MTARLVLLKSVVIELWCKYRNPSVIPTIWGRNGQDYTEIRNSVAKVTYREPSLKANVKPLPV
jgi:hypothetical protein